MRLVLSLVGLLVVVAFVGWLAKQQLQPPRLPASSAASATALGGTPARQVQQLQTQVGDAVNKALAQGMERNQAESNEQPQR